ncbi:hypothetical protein HF086_014649 [Spodoptera exigua]|uniref:Uncharacterized protein n=1 Tax=Spodoptera exigua TaxID=7107 RepID=A0A922M6L9_SPOEX|nr:hypothetical protein HF086_014649 [Spodoptera exigua]
MCRNSAILTLGWSAHGFWSSRLSSTSEMTRTRFQTMSEIFPCRYSYVDKNADQKEHKPLAPKIEPKKMVRYRDNKIVSLKGRGTLRYVETTQYRSKVKENEL